MQMRVRLHLPTGLVPSINPATISAADSGIAISIRDLATYNPPPMTMDNVSNYRAEGGKEGGISSDYVSPFDSCEAGHARLLGEQSGWFFSGTRMDGGSNGASPARD